MYIRVLAKSGYGGGSCQYGKNRIASSIYCRRMSLVLYPKSSMTPKIYHRAARHRNLARLKTKSNHVRKTIRSKRLQIQSMVLMVILAVAPIVQADPYEVLVVDIAGAHDAVRIDEFRKDAAKFNSLNRQGYSAARPYFSLLNMASGQVYFVFGFRDQVQGIHRRNYPGTIENMRRMKHKGAAKYPHMHWLPVEEIRRLLNGL